MAIVAQASIVILIVEAEGLSTNMKLIKRQNAELRARRFYSVRQPVQGYADRWRYLNSLVHVTRRLTTLVTYHPLPARANS